MQLSENRVINKEFRTRGRNDIVMIDVFPVKSGDVVELTFESKESLWRQGVKIVIDGELGVHGKRITNGVDFWFDTSPAKVIIMPYTDKSYINVYNIWDSDRGYKRESQSASSGMIVEEIEKGRRYNCNDIGFNTNFNKLVFRLETK